SKRQVVTFDQIPKVMVDAVLAIEDRRYFEHGGINFVRLGEAAFIDVTRQRHEQGGSTITMQVSRAFFLSPEKTVKRKMTEMLIATELEQKFSKQQIFEFYANRVDLGQRGSFTISGFAEGARSYFNKDLKDITLPEAALLAGLIQAPSYLSPYRHPERALERRNLVLDSMVETHAITREQADRAKATPLKLAPPNVEASDAPYFVDMVRDAVTGKLTERELNEHEYRIYTTLDPALQGVAAQAVDKGMALVDAAVQKLRTKKIKVGKKQYETKVMPGPTAQVALVAMDPHTGQILALVGGRNYGNSQLNHAVARRPTGSIFKPFVYAAAMNTGVAGGDPVFTPASMISDEATTFTYGDQIYEPRNYKEEYHGDVTARYALALSLNNATVKLAEEVGYDKIAALARAAGISSVKPTPAMALGAYDATPVEMASAYTVFANGGVRRAPQLVNSVRNGKGDIVANFDSDKKNVLDPRVAAVMTNMMEGVLNFGTAYPVRLTGFSTPAAGKTGSSHDGWFAGYTSNLLCIVWVGYDDYSDIRLSGAQTAAPIWGEFMKKAMALPEYSDAKPFAEPSGVVNVQLDKATNLLATSGCPQTYTAAFIDGTQPNQTCDQPTGVGGFFSHIFGTGNKPLPAPPPGAQGSPGTVNANGQVQPGQPVQPGGAVPVQANAASQPEPKKKGLFGKIAGIFKDDKAANPPPKPSDSTGTTPP
ncbi:MAG: PBP1A family penicillin-binding protein, partial [Acidobacteriales bacterium]|nr:PBP1A family penicillin-binding protein [Terriglobales bacterium]